MVLGVLQPPSVLGPPSWCFCAAHPFSQLRVSPTALLIAVGSGVGFQRERPTPPTPTPRQCKQQVLMPVLYGHTDQAAGFKSCLMSTCSCARPPTHFLSRLCLGFLLCKMRMLPIALISSRSGQQERVNPQTCRGQFYPLRGGNQQRLSPLHRHTLQTPARSAPCEGCFPCGWCFLATRQPGGCRCRC